MVLMTCCNTRYATVIDSMNHTCPTITVKATGAGHANILNGNAVVGWAHRKHGFIYYTSADKKCNVVIRSTGSTFDALTNRITNGTLINGTDERD